MSLFSFLTSASKPKHPDVFEKELLQLELRITSQQEKLNTIHSRLNSSLTTVTVYTLSIWLLYSALWYSRSHPLNPLTLLISSFGPSSSLPTSVRSILVSPVILTPFALQSFRWIFRVYYQRQEEAEQIKLRMIKKQLRDKVEEVKNKTAYYSTKELLERYDDQIKQTNAPHNSLTPDQRGRMKYPPMAGPPTDAALQQRNRVTSSSTVTSHNPTDQIESPNGSKFSPAQKLNLQLPLDSPMSQLQQRLESDRSRRSSSVKRGWADRVAEALLGNDEESPDSKYALICHGCLAHNGLVRNGELDSIKYICPKCGTLNPSRTRSLKFPQSNGAGEGNQARSIGEKSEEGSDAEIQMIKKGGSGATGKHPQLENHLRGGRKSLGGPVIRKKPSHGSFDVVEKKRAVSHAHPGASISTSNSTDDFDSFDRTHSDTALEPSLVHDHDGLENDINHPPIDRSQNTTVSTPNIPSKRSNTRPKSKKN